MADKTFLDEEDQIDLELDVPFNEFDDEYPPDSQPNIQTSSKQSNGTIKTHVLVQNVTSCCLAGERSPDELSLENTLLNKTEVTINKEPDKNDVEEGEVLSQDEEMELLKEDPVDNSGENKNITYLSKEKKDLKRKMEDQCAEEGMDIDEGVLLESDDESVTQGKKCKKEDNGVNDTGPEDQPMKRKTRGGKKKKKKKQQVRPVHYGRVPRPIIGRLFRPMIATERDAPEVLAGQLAERLEEKKEDLILQVLKTIGNKKAMEIFQETKEIQVHGGMNTVYGNRRRTSGGIFFYILKSKGYATKEQLKEIFAVEREKAKQLIKEQKRREKELKEQGIQDLRQRLAEKREMLLKTETNESENGNSLEIT